LLLVLLCCGAGSEQARDSASAAGLFEHASAIMNLRSPGAAPFHMQVTFHAYPGMDFAKKGKSSIITGDGSYEEMWLSPEKWRREVRFTGYHAVEVRANGVRKYQADSDYEPSRVLMMLDALLYPVPMNWFSPEYSESHADWKVEHLTAGTMPYVSMTHRERGRNDDWFYYSYSLLHSGIMVRSNYLGLVTSWSRDTVFAGKVVPQHFEIQALGKTLLTADVTITPAGEADAPLFELTGAAATPGMTMRPFHSFEIKRAEYYDPVSVFVGLMPGGVFRQIIDRKGQTRELEVIDAPNPADDEDMVDAVRDKRFYPAKVDGDACEETFWMKG
jgi:hypothetical protein